MSYKALAVVLGHGGMDPPWPDEELLRRRLCGDNSARVFVP